MLWRFCSTLFIFLLAALLPAIAMADPQLSCTSDRTQQLPAQTRVLCQTQCALEKSGAANMAAFAPSGAECSDARAELERSLGVNLWKVAAGCASGAWHGFLENLTNLLAPEEYRKFVAECQKSNDCKRNLARQLEQYRGRSANGQYLISDQELDSKLESLNFNDLLLRSRHNQGTTMDSCQNELGNITRRLSRELSLSESESQKKLVLQKRFDQLAAFDADCPRLLHLSPPGQTSAPNAARALQTVANGTRQTGQALVNGVENWFKKLGISLQCYDGETRAQLICHALGQAFLDPLAVGAGGVFAARAISRAGLRTVQEVATSVLPSLSESRIVRISKPKNSGITESYVTHFEDGGRAIFKPCGYTAIDNCQAEVLAYQMDQRLGLGLVPETITRQVLIEGKVRTGSMQRFVEQAREGGSLRARPSQGDLDKQSFLDYVVRNTDRHEGNYLVDRRGQVHSIDHGAAFQSRPTSTRRSGDFNERAEAFLKTPEGEQTLKNMRAWDMNEVQAWLRSRLTPDQTEGALERIEFLRQYRPGQPPTRPAPAGTRDRGWEDLIRD